MTHLTAIVITLNEEKHIVECLETLQFADSTLVFDSHSQDKTVELAKTNGANVFQREFDNYASQRNSALDAVRDNTDWVLFIDADERVSPELADEIRQAIQQTDKVGWDIPRHNYIFGKLTKGAGWYPDYQTRLLRVDSAYYDPERQVHELVILDGEKGQLAHPLIHYNYRDVSHFVDKQQRYTAYDASIWFEEGIRPKPQNYILQPLRHFWWRFKTLKGYQDGFHGFRLSAMMAWYEFRKYVLLRRLWKEKA